MHRNPRRARPRIGIPRGILLHITLLTMKKRPMSGSELMEEIERYTDWRPSPGSIYPLLSQLKEKGMIEPYPNEDPSLKRFSLTEKGGKILEEHKRHDQQLRNRHSSMRKIYWRLHRDMPEDLYDSFSSLIDKVEEVYTIANESPEKTLRLKKVLDETLRELSKISE